MCAIALVVWVSPTHELPPVKLLIVKVATIESI